MIGHAYREYNLIGEREGKYELNPAVLWEKAFEVLRESARECGKEVRAISVTSFGESFVCLDEADEPLCNTMIYMDKRGSEECLEYRAKRSDKEIFSECGQFVDPMFALYKLRWMRKHQPEILEKTKKLCFIADFITYRLGAEHQCDYSLAARSAMFNVFTKEWIDSAIEFSTIDRSILPKPVPSGSVVGLMSRKMAEEMGMAEGVKLIVSGHDQIMAALGSGAWEPGDVANGMGTVDCITAVMQADQLNLDALIKYNFPVVPFMDTGYYVTYAFNMSGGCAVKWFRDTIAKDLAGREDAYRLLDGEATREPTGIIVLPYLAGGGTPFMDGATPAAIAGLRLGTSRGRTVSRLPGGRGLRDEAQHRVPERSRRRHQKDHHGGRRVQFEAVDANPRGRFWPSRIPAGKQGGRHAGQRDALLHRHRRVPVDPCRAASHDPLRAAVRPRAGARVRLSPAL